MLAYEAEEKEYDALEQPGRRRVSSALAGEAEKEEGAGCSGAPAQAEKEVECHHAPEKEEAAGCSGAPAQAEKEAECPDHSPEEEAECRHAPEKEAECPDHSPKEEAECPYSPEPSSSEA